MFSLAITLVSILLCGIFKCLTYFMWFKETKKTLIVHTWMILNKSRKNSVSFFIYINNAAFGFFAMACWVEWPVIVIVQFQ